MAEAWQEILDNWSSGKEVTTTTTSSTGSGSSKDSQAILDDFSGSSQKEKYDAAIAPVAEAVKARMTVGNEDEEEEKEEEEEEEKKLDFFQKGAFEDGWQAGDLVKTILGTTGDAALGVVKGVGSLAEGLLDLGRYATAGVADLAGADEYANKLRKSAQENIVDKVTLKASDYLDQYSVLGRTSDAIMQGLGQVGGIVATGGLGSAAGLSSAGVTALTSGVMGLSGMGSGMGEAYQGGATDGEAVAYGAISGAADALTELMFGGLGKAVNAVGLSKGLSSADDMLAKAISSKFKNQIAKNFAEYGVKASAEGLEEVVAGVSQAMGKKLTYMSEKDIQEILKDENLLEQFVVGSTTSGMIQAGFIPGTSEGSLIEANKQESDFLTGTTKNEKAVIDKLVADEIAKREKDGKKVSGRDKSNIEADIVRDMEKGYISTDTIEEVLGGESYSAYKNTVDSEDAILKEYEELGMKQNATLKEQARYAELTQQVKDIKENSQREVLKTKLRDDVMGLVKGDRLTESYNERTRKGQKFEADLTKYDEKQRQHIQDAIDSGVLHNGNRSHEIVDYTAKVSADTGLSIKYSNSEKIKADGLHPKRTVELQADGSATEFDLGIKNLDEGFKPVVKVGSTEVSKYKVDFKNGKITFDSAPTGDVSVTVEGTEVVDAVYTKDGIILNVESPKYLEALTGHEVGHSFEKAKNYNNLFNAVKAFAEAKGEWEDRVKYRESTHNGIENADPEREVVNDLLGEYLFQGSDFIMDLSVNHRNVFQKIFDEIKYLCKVATAGSKEARRLEAVKHEFEKVYREIAAQKNTADSGVMYGIGKTSKMPYIDQLNMIEKRKMNGSNSLYVGKPSESLQKAGFSDAPFAMNQSDYRKSRREAGNNKHYSSHAVPYEFFENLPKHLSNAPMFVDNGGKVSVITDYGMKDTKGNDSFVIAGVWANQQMESDTVNLVRSIYPLDDIADRIQRAAEEGKLVVENKNKATEMLATIGIQPAEVSRILSLAKDTLTQKGENVNYSLSDDSDGRKLSPAVAKRFGNSKVVDKNGNLKRVYHGTASGEFTVFDKAKGSVEGDFGSGFYFTDNEADVSEHYEGGGPDFDNKVARLAEQIESDEDIDYDEAEERARAELYKGSHKFEVYLNIENPAVVGKTVLFTGESYLEQYNEEDYDDYDDYLADVEQAVSDDIENIVWEVEKNVDVYSVDGLADVLFEAYSEGGIEIEELKEKINNLYLEDSNGNLVGNEVARQVIESLGYDGIIDPTVSGKWNMEIDEGTSHYIVFKPNQIKAITNQNPTDNPDIHRSLSNANEQAGQSGYRATLGKDVALRAEDIAPTVEESSFDAPTVSETESVPVTQEAPIAEPANENAPSNPIAQEEKKQTRKEYHQSIVDNIKASFKARGFDFDEVLKKAKNLSTWATVDNTPQRVMEKSLGYNEGGILADITVNKVAQNESDGIKWLNDHVKQLKQISKEYSIKPGSKESAAAQMFAEGFYVNEKNEIVRYGEPELIQDFKDPKVRERIKGLARDPRIRNIYDTALAEINESRARNLYPEIPKLDNYFLHFRAMNDTFSTLGLPFNPNDIRAKDLPTDLNGVTADLKPGQPYFASANHRTGKRTSFDLLGGVERYLNSAKNQIYHIDDIQTLRALRNYIAETYGQASGLEDIDSMSDVEAEERIKQVYDSHLSTFAKFLNEEANVLAGKTALVDRGIEGLLGRRAMTFLNTLKSQVGSNMVGGNVSSSLTNFMPVAQTFAKANKFDFTKAFAQTVANKLSGGKLDTFAEDSPVVIRRKGTDRFAKTMWQKMAEPGYVLMGAVDDISTEIVARTKYNELTRKGMDSQKAHFETDKWVSKLMGDRSLGQQPQLYNSKMFGLLTQFQLEVRNQLDMEFYDTYQEAKASNEEIENALLRNAKTAAKTASVIAQLTVAQHLYGKAFEAVAGYNPAFDIIEVLMTAFGYDDEEDSEDTVLDNLSEALLALAEDLPYTSIFTGGRIPISAALPDVNGVLRGEDEYGNEIGVPQAAWEEIKDIAPYYIMPTGYGQVKKTYQGLKMFSDEHPIAGSYTDAGNLRYPVDDTVANKIQAGLFGQYANKNAQKYFDQEQKTLNPDQTAIFAEMDIPIDDYWDYRDNLNDFYDVKDKAKEAANAEGATDEDILRNKYFTSVNSDISKLYEKQKEIVKSDSPNKQQELREIQEQMEEILAKSDYESDVPVSVSGAYAEAGDRRYNFDADDKTWYEIKPKKSNGDDNWYYIQEQLSHDKLGISYEDFWNENRTPAENATYYAEYNGKRYNYDADKSQWYEIREKNDDGSDNWYYQKEQEVTKGLGIDYEEYWSKPKEYNYAYDEPGRYAISQVVGGYDEYMVYKDALENWQSDNYIASDKDANGNSISGSRKNKVIEYIDGLDLDDGEKMILYRTQYSSKKDKRAFNEAIVDYLNERDDVSYSEMKSILEELGMKVDDKGNIKLW